MTYVDPYELEGAEYNPRKIDDSTLRQLAHNIALFGFVEAVTVAKEDNQVIGGHQRIAAAKMLLEEDYTPLGDDGQELEFERPEQIPVIYVEGLNDRDRKTLNLALNRISGDWDKSKLSDLMTELYDGVLAELQEVESSLSTEVEALSALMPTGFDGDEIAKLLKAADVEPELAESQAGGDGTMPKNAKGVAKLSLEFTSPEVRDATKEVIARIAEEDGGDRPWGDIIAEALEVEV
jgi:ParB-like chromosome segregation protein Spo0J